MLVSDTLEGDGEQWGFMQLIVVPPFALRIAAHSASEELLGDSGKVSLSIPKPGLQASDYDSVYAFMRERPVVTRTVTLNGITGPVPFRYPPVPSTSSFNIFGPLYKIVFSRATGEIALGMRNISLPVPSIISMSEIRKWEAVPGVVPLPVEVDLAKDSSHIQVTAWAKLTINNQDASSWWYLHYDLLGLVLSLIGVIVAVIPLASQLKSMVK